MADNPFQEAPEASNPFGGHREPGTVEEGNPSASTSHPFAGHRLQEDETSNPFGEAPPERLDSNPFQEGTAQGEPSPMVRNSFASVMTTTTFVERSGWEPDCSNCQICNATFSLVTRRHHCRMCGKCVCKPCSNSRVPLEGQQETQRACTPCVAAATQSGPIVLSVYSRLRALLSSASFRESPDNLAEAAGFLEDTVGKLEVQHEDQRQFLMEKEIELRRLAALDHQVNHLQDSLKTAEQATTAAEDRAKKLETEIEALQAALEAERSSNSAVLEEEQRNHRAGVEEANPFAEGGSFDSGGSAPPSKRASQKSLHGEDNVLVSWMYADLNPIAMHDPMRWSQKTSFPLLLIEVQAANKSFARPVLVRYHADDKEVKKYKASSLQELKEMHEEPDVVRTRSFTSVTVAGKDGGAWEVSDSCAVCQMSLGKRYLKKKHHCRACGKCICSACSPSLVQLLSGQEPQRVCTPCVSGAFMDVEIVQGVPPKM